MMKVRVNSSIDFLSLIVLICLSKLANLGASKTLEITHENLCLYALPTLSSDAPQLEKNGIH